MPLIAGGGASPADVHEMALQSFRIKFLATRAAVLDLPEKPIARACRRVHNHPGRPLAGQRAWQQSPAAISESPLSATYGKLNIEAAA